MDDNDKKEGVITTAQDAVVATANGLILEIETWVVSDS